MGWIQSNLPRTGMTADMNIMTIADVNVKNSRIVQ